MRAGKPPKTNAKVRETASGFRLQDTAIVLVIAVLFGLFVASSCSSRSKEQPRPDSAVLVTVADVTLKTVPLQLSAIGHAVAHSTVTVKPQIDGELIAVDFREGQDVKTGDVLFKIDPRPFEEQLRKDEATLAKDQALEEQAAREEERYKQLVEKEYVSREQYDQIKANAQAAEATVKADMALVENDRLMLEYTTIRSPIDGRTGPLLVNEGNIVTANSTELVTINTVSPIYAVFSVPEQNLPDVEKYAAKRRLKVQAIVPGHENNPVEGYLSFIDNTVDSETGTIQLRATFQNRDETLWPGQFVNIVLTLAERSDVPVIPAQALQSGQSGQYVFVVNSDKTVESRQVTVMRMLNGEAAIEKGLAAGETVVTDGQLQLVPGAKVEIKNAGGADQGQTG
jgi:multidrug efflux system membrane fusion protein